MTKINLFVLLLLCSSITAFASTSACGLEQAPLFISVNKTISLSKHESKNGDGWNSSVLYYNNGKQVSRYIVSSNYETSCSVHIQDSNIQKVDKGEIFALVSGTTDPENKCSTRLTFTSTRDTTLILECERGSLKWLSGDLTLKSIKYNLGTDFQIFSQYDT